MVAAQLGSQAVPGIGNESPCSRRHLRGAEGSPHLLVGDSLQVCVVPSSQTQPTFLPFTALGFLSFSSPQTQEMLPVREMGLSSAPSQFFYPDFL